MDICGEAKSRRRFMFENAWLTDSGCKDVVVGSWNSSMADTLPVRLEKCSLDLKKWGVLAGRRVPVDVFCPLCRHHPESLDHLMKDCEIVAPLWQTILTDNIPGIGEGGIAWLCDILTRGEAVLKLRIIATWWSIWRARNELVWNGKPWQLNTVVNEIQRSMETWQNLGNITGNRAREILRRRESGNGVVVFDPELLLVSPDVNVAAREYNVP
nr:uncharacterized protein LOC109160848 [Ipomoea trifida]